MITTIYKCDKCGAEQTNNDQFWSITVFVENASVNYRKGWQGIQVCRSCLGSLNIFPTKTKASDPAAPPPTLEDLIREIVRSEQEGG